MAYQAASRQADSRRTISPQINQKLVDPLKNFPHCPIHTTTTTTTSIIGRSQQHLA